jgi:hypothetical protein
MQTGLIVVAEIFLLLALVCNSSPCLGQENSKTSAYAVVNFDRPIRAWDGFGFNYVETSQTFDYDAFRQDYGGFSLLKPEQKEEIAALVFGEEGLKVGLVKMFLDPFHQKTANGAYDHVSTTVNMRDFVRRGLQKTKEGGRDIAIITTLYGPPGYMTIQKSLRGRDLDPRHLTDLCAYYTDWAKFLLRTENFPLRYVSLHNEGEDWGRWPADGSVDETAKGGHDYNLFFSAVQTTKVLKELRAMLDKNGLQNIGVTNGEYTNWYRFNAWGFASALESDKEAIRSLGLITSHGFYVGDMTSGHWFAPHSSSGSDRLRQIKPELHAWTTSTAWNASTRTTPRVFYMDEQFIKEIHGSIIDAKVNGIIPWAGIQRASHWNKPDPNPGCAIRVFDDGTWEIQKAYYYYKQVSRAGQPGMVVVDASVMSSELSILAFGNNGTRNPNAIVVINQSEHPRSITINLKGRHGRTFQGFRTSGRQDYVRKETSSTVPLTGDNYRQLEKIDALENIIQYEAPPHSVTTFYDR